MNPTTASSSNSGSGRCGMCGSCGAMPPWAPEMLKNTSAAARRALERRMREAQMQFIEERDARLQEEKIQHHSSETGPHAPAPDTTDQDAELSANHNQEISNRRHATQAIDCSDEGNQDWKPFSYEALENPAEQADQQLVSTSTVPRQPQTETKANIELVTPANSDRRVSEARLEDDANFEIPLDTIRLPPLPLPDEKIHQMETSNLLPEDHHVFQPPRRKLPQLSSPALLESPLPSETPELHTLPDISLEEDQLSEPLRTISLRDAESDADSYHTAQGEDVTQLSSDSLSLKNGEELDKNVAPIVSEVEWQAFQRDEAVSEPKAAASEALPPALPERPVTLTKDHASLEGHTRDIPNSELDSSKADTLISHPIENSGDSVTRRTTKGSAPPLSHGDVCIEDYALPTDLVQTNAAELAPKPCQDCERWRERVRELELKVEALTSALNAREMESASMRARAVDRRYHGKSEAQLMEECESLRITTEYLYYKLERYEKKVSGSHPAVH